MLFDDVTHFSKKQRIEIYTHQLDTLRALKISTAIEVVPSTALPPPSYPDTGHLESTNQHGTPVRLQPISA